MRRAAALVRASGRLMNPVAVPVIGLVVALAAGLRPTLAQDQAQDQAPAGTRCGDALDAGARRVIEAEGLRLAWAARPHPLPLDRHFALDIVVCGARVQALRVDADMPAHRHGMNYRATVSESPGGRFAAQGLLFHMPGRWRLIFDVDTVGSTRRLTQEIEVR